MKHLTDSEIEKAAIALTRELVEENGVDAGAKWYREQMEKEEQHEAYQRSVAEHQKAEVEYAKMKELAYQTVDRGIVGQDSAHLREVALNLTRDATKSTEEWIRDADKIFEWLCRK